MNKLYYILIAGLVGCSGSDLYHCVNEKGLPYGSVSTCPTFEPNPIVEVDSAIPEEDAAEETIVVQDAGIDAIVDSSDSAIDTGADSDVQDAAIDQIVDSNVPEIDAGPTKLEEIKCETNIHPGDYFKITIYQGFNPFNFDIYVETSFNGNIWLRTFLSKTAGAMIYLGTGSGVTNEYYDFAFVYKQYNPAGTHLWYNGSLLGPDTIVLYDSLNVLSNNTTCTVN